MFKKNIYKKIVLCCLILSSIIFSLLLFWLKVTEFRIFNLEHKFSDISMQIKIKDESYSVIHGHINGNLNILKRVKLMDLLAFYQWTKEDPLFYSPDLNTDKLIQVVNSIDEHQRKYLDYIKEKNHIYPTDFLKSFAQVAKLTREFLKSPTLEMAQNLIAKQKKTTHFYKIEAENLSSVILKKGPNKKFAPVTILSARSTETITSGLALIAGNASLLSSEIDKRELCLMARGDCLRPSNKFEKPASLVIDDSNLKKAFLDKKLIFAPLEKTFDDSSIQGPYRAKTPCFGWGENFSSPEHYFYINNKTEDIDIELATEIYFRKLSSGTQAPDEKILKDSGINYLHANASGYYYCDNNEYFAEIAELDRFLLENKPVLSVVNPFEDKLNIAVFEKARAYEKAFFESKYPSYENLRVLGLHYGYLYKVISQDKNYSNKNSLQEGDLLQRYLVITRKLGYFEKLLYHADGFIKFNIDLDPLLGRNHDFAYNALYPFRNFYGVMYLPFSPVVYRTNEKPPYVNKINIKNSVMLDGAYMSYSQAITKYPKNEILSWFTKRSLLQKKL